jgi:hypothetical protein
LNRNSLLFSFILKGPRQIKNPTEYPIKGSATDLSFNYNFIDLVRCYSLEKRLDDTIRIPKMKGDISVDEFQEYLFRGLREYSQLTQVNTIFYVQCFTVWA